MHDKATVITLPDLRLMVSRAQFFPSGIKAAWERLEAPLASLMGRKFYGLTFTQGDEMAYYAGLEPLDNDEVAALSFPLLSVKGGQYARTKLLNWIEQADKISEIIGGMIEQFGADATRPTIEYYRSQSELHLLVPVPEQLPG